MHIKPSKNYLQLLHAQPSAYLRIHHFLNLLVEDSGITEDSYAQLALLGEGDDVVERAIHAEARNLSRMRRALARNPVLSQGYDFRYHDDIIADWPITRIENYLREIAAEIGRLAWLSDNAIIKLGVSPDVACMNCAKRRHCDLADVSEFSSPDDTDTSTISREQYACNRLKQHLDIARFKEGKDYLVGTEAVTLKMSDGGYIDADAPYMLITLRAVHGLVAPR